MDSTPARSTRSKTRAGSVTPAPSVAGTSATARGRGRTNRTPKQTLPAVTTATSHAYGARGKINLTSQLEESGGEDELLEGFGITRGAASGRDATGGFEDIDTASRAGNRRRSHPTTNAPSDAASTRSRTRKSHLTTGTQVVAPIAEEFEEEQVTYQPQPDPEPGPSGGLRYPKMKAGWIWRYVNTDGSDAGIDPNIDGYASDDAETDTPPVGFVRGFGEVPESGYLKDSQQEQIMQQFQQQLDQQMETPHVPSRGLPTYPSFTDMNSVFSYGGGNVDGRVRGLSVPVIHPPPSEEEIRAARPWSLIVLYETFVRWIQNLIQPFRQLPVSVRNLLVIGIVLLPILTTLFPDLVNGIAESGGRAYYTVSSAVTAIRSRATQAEGAANGTAFDKFVYTRLSRLETDVSNIKTDVISIKTGITHMQQQFGLLRESTEELQKILPEQLVVPKNQQTGQFEIPEGFWLALKDRLVHDADSQVPSWESFINNNKAHIQELIDGNIQPLVTQNHIITKEMFTQLLEENLAKHAALEEKYDRRFDHHISKFKHYMLFQPHVPQDIKALQLHNLALMNIARNTDIALHKVNYFSIGLGAVIDPYLTSTTHKRQQKSFMANAWTKLPWYDGPRAWPPSAALSRWEEATDCWCAAESTEKGKAQIGVLMPRPIVPTSVTIEHIPSQGTLDIASAPKKVEIWVQTNMEASVSGKWERNSIKEFQQECGTVPAPGYVCAGHAEYDVHGFNHVQNFPLQRGEWIGLVNKAVVRVVNNWGQDWTCLYRVRMHGLTEEEVKAKEELEVPVHHDESDFVRISL
ncbi:hypothetical protein H2203_003154 [Taxawa tesnikishii (nom. ined.)]|nr:hypothetical protein H2203_003154 [Dothideales sp. JES 119]